MKLYREHLQKMCGLVQSVENKMLIMLELVDVVTASDYFEKGA